MHKGEQFNSYSHLAGVILALIGCIFLLIKASETNEAYKIVSSAAYSACLILLYAGSTIYHSTQNLRLKPYLQKLDFCAIYLLIAGSYTPFTLVTLNGAWGWSLFGISWGLAILGIAQELTVAHKIKNRIVSLIIYFIMGWIVIVAMYPLVKTLSLWGLFWLCLGGILYSSGIYWFINDKKIKHGHGIWHLFVLSGSISQFICIYFYVM